MTAHEGRVDPLGSPAKGRPGRSGGMKSYRANLQKPSPPVLSSKPLPRPDLPGWTVHEFQGKRFLLEGQAAKPPVLVTDVVPGRQVAHVVATPEAVDGEPTPLCSRWHSLRRRAPGAGVDGPLRRRTGTLLEGPLPWNSAANRGLY